MFDLNPLNNPNAWWQHLLMLVGAGIIGYIIGYRSRRGLIVELEDELAGLDAELDDCQSTGASAPAEVVAPEPIVPATTRAEPATPLMAVAEPMDAVVEKPPVAPVVPAAPPQHDNLKLVEGIGPKIEVLLNKEGILTFRQLSEASRERLTDILRAAGSRFQMHDPTSWPRQAELAADSKWDELKTWQGELKKGRLS